MGSSFFIIWISPFPAHVWLTAYSIKKTGNSKTDEEQVWEILRKKKMTVARKQNFKILLLDDEINFIANEAYNLVGETVWKII